MERSQKEALVGQFHEIFGAAQGGVLVDFQGMTVDQITVLRKALNKKEGRFRVIQNRLARIASKGTPFEDLVNDFKETRALVYSDDPVSIAKIVSDAAKDNEKFKLIAGILVTGDKGERLDAAGITELGNLPSREELIGKLLFMLNAPTTQFVRTLNEIPSSLVRVLQATADSKN